MNSRRNYQILVLVSVCLMTSSCSNPTGPETQSRAAPTGHTQKAPTKLVFGQRLLESDLKLLTAFADINGDGKPDMILGSNGHVFSDTAPQVTASVTSSEYRHYVSHLLNASDGTEIRFDEPYWPNPHGDDGQLPGG